MPRVREGVKPWELPKLGLQGNYLSGLIISIKIDFVGFFFLDQILMLKCKVGMAKVKILSEEWRARENTISPVWFLFVNNNIKTEINTCAGKILRI